MTPHSISTDNANLKNKVLLRELSIRGLEEVKVLDLFAGENKIWSQIKTDRYYGVEEQKGKGINLFANNLKVIPPLDLSEFNVIDCDSYGIPFEQVEALYRNKTLQKGTVIIYTCISNAISTMNGRCLRKFHLEKMYKKSKILINKLSINYFFEMLRQKGITHVTEYEDRNSFTKKYGFFKVT